MPDIFLSYSRPDRPALSSANGEKQLLNLVGPLTLVFPDGDGLMMTAIAQRAIVRR